MTSNDLELSFEKNCHVRPKRKINSTFNTDFEYGLRPSEERRSKPQNKSLNLNDKKRVVKRVYTRRNRVANNQTNLFLRNNTLLDKPRVKLLKSIQLNLKNRTDPLSNNNIPSLIFGIIGYQDMGCGIATQLLKAGHKVVVWDQTMEEYQFHLLVDGGARFGLSPSDVVQKSNIIFTFISDIEVAKIVVFGDTGVLSQITPGKGFVEMSSYDIETSKIISEAVIFKGGRYLETRIHGSEEDAKHGKLVCMSAGDKTLFNVFHSAFSVISKKSYYLGEVGAAIKMNCILNSINATTMVGLAEVMSLACKARIPQIQLVNLLESGVFSFSSSMLSETANAMFTGKVKVNKSVKTLQNDVSLTLNWAETMEFPLLVLSTVNEMLKKARHLGYTESDASDLHSAARI